VVLRGWDPPADPYGPGHRGVDLAAAAGDPVRAVAGGRVAFAGRVAGRGVVSVDLAETGDPPLRTTYEPVRASVHEGDEVEPGEVLGVLEPPTAHCTGPCLHWGLRRGEAYLNPLSLLPPWLLRAGPSRLLRVDEAPVP
jgi:murein DD-endopeptidase MepM/ murein hydrolase activator NlpD